MNSDQLLHLSSHEHPNWGVDPIEEHHTQSKSSHDDRVAGDRNKNSELISINLIYDYPVYWTRFKVLRDFVQNFYDAVGWSQWDRQFSYKLSDGMLILNAQDIGFSYDWLLHIGASTKREQTGSYAGYFGEGFKIAALCGVRDYQWNIEVFSRDWELAVVTTHLKVDSQQLKSLAYKIQRHQTPRADTTLRIFPFDDEMLLNSVLLSFYYPSNPLFGKQIWASTDCAVYFRSKEPKPIGYPATYDDQGQGIVFAAYQALGSFQYPLIFCFHHYRHNDRERNSFFRMDVVKLIQRTTSNLSPEASATVLQVLRNRWYDRPRKKYDFESWYEIIRSLIKNIARSPEQTLAWKKENPYLLVAPLVKRNDLPRYNRRRQALDWLRSSGQSFRLVQSAFLELGYPTLEDVCEQNDGFSITREPDVVEQIRITMLEEFVRLLIPDLFVKMEIPPCKIIKSENATWQGMASCIPLTSQLQSFRGIPIRYRLPYVALKSSLLRSTTFGHALSTYLHELAHMFGGDRSAAFSHALSELMEITLTKVRLVAQWQEQWENHSDLYISS